MGSKLLIVNELLAFVVHAIDTMDEVSILQICKFNFKEEDICSGKALLFQSLGKSDRMPSRRRDGGEKSLQDIITLLKETDPNDVPDFVAKELHKLPPVTFDHVDVTRLLKDITSLKVSLADVLLKLEASENTIGELRAEVALLRDAKSVFKSPEASISKVNLTLLYVSRLHYSTKAEDIVDYVEKKTNIRLRVEQLQSCHNDFKSFVVRVPTADLSTFMKEEFWPKNVLFRRFRGRLHDTAQMRHTSQITQRVSK